MTVRSLLPCLLTLALADASAQKGSDQRRSQPDDRYLPVQCHVTANSGRAEGFIVHLYKENELIQQIPVGRKSSGIELELDLNANYAVRFSKPGFRDKLVCIDTHLPEGQEKYDLYGCDVNLEPMDRFVHSDAFYLDFPGALVRWNDAKKAFTHNDDYLADIQLKVAMLGAQLETR
jgi:hypothetical protein